MLLGSILLVAHALAASAQSDIDPDYLDLSEIHERRAESDPQFLKTGDLHFKRDDDSEFDLLDERDEPEPAYFDASRLHFRADGKVPLRIMPVGASVTFGVGSTTGDSYRKDLQGLLTAQGMTVEYVGSKKNGKDFDNNKVEATSGFVISQIANSVKKAAPEFKPNLVLLEAGTNNCNKGGDVPDAGKSVSSIIDGIYQDSPGATVILATILTNKEADQDKCRQGINAQYQTLATDYAAKKSKFVLVDMRSPEGPTTADLNDTRHPNDAGYVKMANVWLKGIQEAETKGFLTAPAAVAADVSEKHWKGGQGKNSTKPAGGKEGKKNHNGQGKNSTQPATGKEGGKKPQKGQPAKNSTQPAEGKPRGGQTGGAQNGGKKGAGGAGQKQNATKTSARPSTPAKSTTPVKSTAKPSATPTKLPANNGTKPPTPPVKGASSVAYEVHAFITAGMIGAVMFLML